MTKKILFFVLIALIGLNTFSQRGQRIGFVDMNYILENIPAYTRAQTQLDKKVLSWQQDLDKIKNEISVMQADLSNEKALLTEDLIADKEEDIIIKQLELKKTEEEYFSSNGSLFLLRKQLVTPIQDQVYNASQEIAKARKYDFVFDKSSDLIMLYSNKANDISELVLRSIVKGEKITAAKVRREKASLPKSVTNARPTTNNSSNPTTTNNSSIPTVNSSTSTPEIKNADEVPEISVADERNAKRAAALAKIEQQKLDRAKKRADQKAAIEKKRLERLKQQEEVRNQLKNNKDKKIDDKKEDSKEEEKEDEKNENNN